MWEDQPYTLDLSDVIRISDDDLLKISAANPDLRIERNAAGQLEIMAPSGISSTVCETKFVGALYAWNERHGGGIVCSGTGGFKLPNTAVRVPDASWFRVEVWNALSKDQQDKYAPIVPEFLVEVRSRTDSLNALHAKMHEWIENGCRMAWMIDPIKKEAYVYRADGSVEQPPFDSILTGEDVLPGFEFDLKKL